MKFSKEIPDHAGFFWAIGKNSVDDVPFVARVIVFRSMSNGKWVPEDTKIRLPGIDGCRNTGEYLFGDEIEMPSSVERELEEG